MGIWIEMNKLTGVLSAANLKQLLSLLVYSGGGNLVFSLYIGYIY